MDQLNKEQLEAVKHKDGPVLVLAAPGSGKTQTICYRIKELITKHGVREEKICVMTFTKAAAMTMLNRVKDLLERDVKVSVGTIHSLCYQILFSYPGYSSLEILSEQKKQLLIKSIFHNVFPTEKIDEEKIGYLSERLSYFIFHQNELEEDSSFKKLMDTYIESKRKNGCMDFDDLIHEVLLLFRNDEEFLLKWQQKFTYYMVDEFQDVNEEQLQIISMLCKKHRNIMVVGDDDQSIYGFRGAMPGVFEKFEVMYGERKIFHLNINYRSAKRIIEISQDCIKHNCHRYRKDIWGYSEENGIVEYKEFATKDEEAQAIIRQAMKHKDSCILFRTKYQMKEFMDKIHELGYYTGINKEEGIKEIVEDLLAYIQLIEGKIEVKNISRIMNRPQRNLSKFFLLDDISSLTQWESFCHECKEMKQAQSIHQLREEIFMMKKLGPFLGMKFFLEGCGYRRFVKENRGIYQMREEALDELFDVFCLESKKMNNWMAYGEWLRRKKFHVNLEGMEETQHIHFMTMHASKGLEFDKIFIPNLTEKVMPGRNTEGDEMIEEERRLLYVAMTRAKKGLYLSCAEEKDKKSGRKSRFLKELGY